MIDINISAFQAKRIKVKAKVKNIKSARNWLKYVNSDKFHDSIFSNASKERTLKKILERCKDIIDEEIYIPEPDDQVYERTYALIRAFTYQVISGKYSILFGEDLNSTAGNSNRWNPTGSPLAVAGSMKGIAAYMYFFERSAKSFIPPHRQPERLFMKALTDAVYYYMKHTVHSSVGKALKGRFGFLKK